MYIKILATNEIKLCDGTRSSNLGWWFETTDNLQYHESDIIVCQNK